MLRQRLAWLDAYAFKMPYKSMSARRSAVTNTPITNSSLPANAIQDGATRLSIVVGDPIAQVKAPHTLTAKFAAAGHNGILVPLHVAPKDLAEVIGSLSKAQNLDSIVVTVPHKFACFSLCQTATERANFLGAVNLMRRNADGSWHGEMIDGPGFVGAVKANGGVVPGRRALLIGAGGAGSAIALELVQSGVRELAIHDADIGRRDVLIAKLNALQDAHVVIGSTDPTGFDIIANATPAGMNTGDPYPVDVTKFTSAMFVGCVITSPPTSPMVEAARKIGCKTSVGLDMVKAELDMMVDFLVPKAGNAL
jgi:shikimate dehydrogenase